MCSFLNCVFQGSIFLNLKIWAETPKPSRGRFFCFTFFSGTNWVWLPANGGGGVPAIFPGSSFPPALLSVGSNTEARQAGRVAGPISGDGVHGAHPDPRDQRFICQHNRVTGEGGGAMGLVPPRDIRDRAQWAILVGLPQFSAQGTKNSPVLTPSCRPDAQNLCLGSTPSYLPSPSSPTLGPDCCATPGR